jgi:NitT/TauT family transport system ATP-binding protein
MPAMIGRKSTAKTETHTAAPAGTGSPAEPGLLSVEGVSKTYQRKVRGQRTELTVLNDISFTARQGELIAIIGPSGCGKSTILNAIAGLTDYEGEIHFDGELVTGPGPERSVVFQHASLLPWRTVEDNVAFGLQLRRDLSRDQIAHKAAEELARVGLSGFEKHYPHQISGGMQQRVNIARALAVEPRLILMDEPFGALDALTRETLQDQLFEFIGDKPRTTIFITHDIAEAVYLADKIIVMSPRPGRVLMELRVDFDRPRSRPVTETPEFEAIVRQMRELLRPADQHADGTPPTR